MITVEEHIIDLLTETIYRFLNSEDTPEIQLPEGFPKNEIWQLTNFINLVINQGRIFSDLIYSFSAGNLDIPLPKGNSRALYALKDLQSHLLHLTWQAQQIANGDYNQKVDFMGDFSIAFNKMTQQLKTSFDEIKRQNQELTESEQKLKESNATKDKLFSIIAHDLRGPIGNFMSMMSVLVDPNYKISSKKKNEILVEVKTAAEHTYNLLENLLSWSRNQQGMISYDPQNNDLKAILEENISLLGSIANKKNIKLYCEVSGSVTGYFDKETITIVIRNLTSNALKFTNSGGEILLSSEIINDHVEVSVKDNGVGMDEKSLNKLFRIDETLTTYGTNGEKGTGLGLILCKEFVEKNKGKIWTESEKGKGTKFIFTLPISY